MPCTYALSKIADVSASFSKFGASARAFGFHARTRSARSASMITNTTYFGAAPRAGAGFASPGTTSAAFDTCASSHAPFATRSMRAALFASVPRSTAAPVPTILPSTVVPSSPIAVTPSAQLPSSRSARSFAPSGTDTNQLIAPPFGTTRYLPFAS